MVQGGGITGTQADAHGWSTPPGRPYPGPAAAVGASPAGLSPVLLRPPPEQAAARRCWPRPLPTSARPTSSPSRCAADHFFHWNAFVTLPSQMPRPTSSPSRCDQRVAGLPCNPARSTSRAGVAVEGGLAPSCALCWNRPLACCIDVLTASLCSPTRPATLLQGPELLTMWFGESEANVREIFDKASWLIHGYQGMGWATGVQWRLCELEANA